MGVDRCICTNQTFEHLINQAKHLGIGDDLDALEAATGAGGSCGICRPYILLALRTGKTDLPVLSQHELDEMHRHAQQKNRMN